MVGPMSTTGTTQRFSYGLSGTDPLCVSGANPDGTANSCLIAVYESRTCTAASGSKYYIGATDPWTAENNVVYTSSTAGAASGSGLTVPSGAPEVDLHGKVVIVHDYAGNQVACARLGDQIFLQRLLAIPRVSRDNCRNLKAISEGTAQAVPVTTTGTDVVAAGTLRSVPLLNEANCNRVYPYPTPRG